MYKHESIFKPYSIDEAQDMWVGTISYHSDVEASHTHCIEIRDESESGLRTKMNLVINALNSVTEDQHTVLKHFNAIHILISFIKTAGQSSDSDIARKAYSTLREWDKARG